MFYSLCSVLIRHNKQDDKLLTLKILKGIQGGGGVCRGVTVHKIHSSVRYDTVVSRFGMFLIQQKERNAREISFIFTNSVFLKTIFLL